MILPLQMLGGVELLVVLLIFLIPIAAIVLLVRFIRRYAGGPKGTESGTENLETERGTR
jgi:hypothetical protein